MALILWDTDEYRILVSKPDLYQLQQKFLILKGVSVMVKFKTEQSIMEQNFTTWSLQKQLARCCGLPKGVTSFRESEQLLTHLF